MNVVLLARRPGVLDEVAAGIAARTGAETRTLAVDLTGADAHSTIVQATADLDVGLLVYCAGADADYVPFLANTIDAAEGMLQRNCRMPMRLCHHFAAPMVRRGKGGVVIFGSGAGFVGTPNMVAYGATKAFDMIFAESLWSELKPQGVDVLGVILGETDTPALRRLRHARGLAGPDKPVEEGCHGRRGRDRDPAAPREGADADGRPADPASIPAAVSGPRTRWSG